MNVYVALIFMMSIVVHGLIIAVYGPGNLAKLVFDG